MVLDWEKMMKKLLLILLLLFSTAAFPFGEMKLGGADSTIIFWKMGNDCIAVDLKNVQAEMPREWTPTPSVLGLGLQPLRPFTAEEREGCFGVVAQLPPPAIVEWVVHNNNSARIDRPAYIYLAGQFIKHSSLRATFGEPCGAQVIPSTRNLQYRYLWKIGADSLMTPYRDEAGNHLVGICVHV